MPLAKTVFWMHGHSTEQDFIYVTTQFMSKEMLTRISDEVGPNRSLIDLLYRFSLRPQPVFQSHLKKDSECGAHAVRMGQGRL